MRVVNAVLALTLVLGALVLGGNRSTCTPVPVEVVCEYDGTTYLPGDTFPDVDDCNLCTCMNDGLVACTRRACLPDDCAPEAELWREYVATSPEQCAVIRFVCEGATSYFANACGCGCEQSETCPEWFNCMPSPDGPACDLDWIRTNCPFSGIAW
jgi:hypothetical protein